LVIRGIGKLGVGKGIEGGIEEIGILGNWDIGILGN
jgi:hypothetical protein